MRTAKESFDTAIIARKFENNKVMSQIEKDIESACSAGKHHVKVATPKHLKDEITQALKELGYLITGAYTDAIIVGWNMDEKEKAQEDFLTLCKCGKNPEEASHTCPYSEDIHGDSESMCNCCDSCRHECAMDI